MFWFPNGISWGPLLLALTHLPGPSAEYFEGCGGAVNADFRLLRPELCATKLATMNRSAAEENLRVIRQLMERATIYPAVSAPAALFFRLSALLVLGLALIPG